MKRFLKFSRSCDSRAVMVVEKLETGRGDGSIAAHGHAAAEAASSL